MSYRRTSLLDRLLAPSTSLMGRLRFGQKAMLIGASFVLTCAVLAGFTISSTQSELAAARRSNEAEAPIASLNQGLIALQQHRALATRAHYKVEIAADVLQANEKSVDDAFAKVEAWSKGHLDDGALDKQLSAARSTWTAARAPHDDAVKIFNDHNTAIAAVMDLMDQVDHQTGLVLTNDPATYFSSRIATSWLPLLAEHASREAVIASRALGEGSIWADDRADLAVAKNQEAYALDEMQSDSHELARLNPALAKKLQGTIAAATKALAVQNAFVQKNVLDAESLTLPIPVMGKRGEATRAQMLASMEAVQAGMRDSSAAEVSRLERKRALVFSAIALALMVTAYLFIGFSRGTRDSLREINEAADLLAQGQFPDSVRVNTRDELRGIGDSIQRAVGTLRNFADAQLELYEQHQAGQIDERLDTEAFPGSFGVMADHLNDLVGSHIAVKMRIIEIVSAYARGDLSQDIERYPGKKAEITRAMDAVKAGMQAVNDEIRQVVEAAVAGDFARRGDASRFEFVYRDMLNSLNSLMATADRSLGELDNVLTAVAAGDLTRHADTNLPGQFGRLAGSANSTVEQLVSIVAQLREASQDINTAAAEIAAGNSDLSQRTEQQAASLEETASSMEELTGTVRQNAENARQANQLANGAAVVASEGGQVVGRVVRTMTEINASSKKVSDIIGVIDGIAFQTNILALNAAVEAARAGEQGRGFAVVASEVRSLAQRSANAAKEIKQLIIDSTLKVEEGSALVDQAGRTMNEIVTSVKKVTDIIGEITSASVEQSAGIEQVNQAITHMDEGVQQNAALVEEASASARSLEQQAEQLVQAVAVFRLGTEPELRERTAELGARVAGESVRAAPARTARSQPAARPAARPARAAASMPASVALHGNDSQWEEF